MNLDIAQQRQESIILLAWCRNLSVQRFERFRVEPFAEVSIGQIEFHVVGIGIGAQCRLEMLDGVVVQTVTREQYADARLGAIVVRR